MPQFVMQKAVFCSAKGDLLQYRRPCFEDEKSAFKGGVYGCSRANVLLFTIQKRRSQVAESRKPRCRMLFCEKRL